MGWTGELESAQELVVEQVRELHKLNPKHKLLCFWLVPEGEETNAEIENQNRIEMKNRFWGRPEPWEKEAGAIVLTVVLTNYFLALKKAFQEITGEVDTPAEPEQRAIPTPTVIEEDDIPF